MTEWLTERNRAVLAFVKRYIVEHGYAPSNREIGEGTGLKSTSSVNANIKKLIKLGYLETDHPESPRALRVKGWMICADSSPLQQL